MNEEFEPGVYEVVGPELLNQRTSEGWTLIRVLYEDELVMSADSETIPVPQPQVFQPNPGYTPPQQTYVPTQILCHSRGHLRKINRYLLRKDAASELARVSLERDEALVSLGNHSKMLAEVEKKVKTLDELLQTTQKRAESIETEKTKEKSRADDNWKALQTAEAKAKTLEANMATVWKAVGDFQMRAILGNPEAQDPQPVAESDLKSLYQRISQEDG